MWITQVTHFEGLFEIKPRGISYVCVHEVVKHEKTCVFGKRFLNTKE